MSAFLVSKQHIDALVAFATRLEYGSIPTYYYHKGSCPFEPASYIGQILWDENNRSVNERYDTNDLPQPYKFAYGTKVLPPVQIIKACNCLDYQSCETPDWKDTRAFAILDAIRERAIRELPGYEEAQWEIGNG